MVRLYGKGAVSLHAYGKVYSAVGGVLDVPDEQTAKLAAPLGFGRTKPEGFGVEPPLPVEPPAPAAEDESDEGEETGEGDEEAGW